MNPMGLFIIGIGLIVFIVGFKGSQHEVINAFKGVTGTKPSTPSPNATAPPVGTNPATGTQTA